MCCCQLACSYTYYQLTAEDEQLLAAVLSRSDATLEQENPFDASSAVLDNSSMEELETLTAQLVQQSSRCMSAVASSMDQSTSMLLSEYSAVGASATPDPAVAEPSASDVVLVGEVGQQPAGNGNSCRPSTAGSTLSTISNRPRHTVAEIDAMLRTLHLGQQQSRSQLQGASDKGGQSSGAVLGE